MTVDVEIDNYKLRRFIAGYKLRLAKKAEALGARPESWGPKKTISIEEEESYLSREDTFRLAPYPYPGLRSFEKEEGNLFFGRESNVEILRAILAEQRLVVVLGGSGSGKSSLVRAGLLPFLNTKRRIKGRDGNWYPVDFRPRTDPFGELSSALVDQVLRPLLRMRRKGLSQALSLPDDVDGDAPETIKFLRDKMRLRFVEARKSGRQQVLNTLLTFVDQELDCYDNIVTRGRRLAAPNLFLLIDQLEEVFRPEIIGDEREALLDLIVDLHSHMRDTSLRGGLFLAATIRSEEVYRCAEHRGLSDVVIGRGGYQIELLAPDNEDDAKSIREAIVQPARNVFTDWGLDEHLDHDDAPFEKGFPDLLLKGAARLSIELNHRPDQLPLLQHALQATWHAAIRRWSRPGFNEHRLEIRRSDLPGQTRDWVIPDLSACLQARADKSNDRAVERFVEAIKGERAIGLPGNREIGEGALQAAFRALARRDDQGNWARRFAGKDEITAFLTADKTSAVAQLPEGPRWDALQEALRVFLLRGYLSRGTEQKYDISHEALIRNWPLFQEWLRAPEEVAYALGRVLMEVEKPEEFERASADRKMQLIPDELAKRVAMVADGGALPTRWGEDQIAPYLLKPTLRKRWGVETYQALRRLTQLAAMAKEAGIKKARHKTLKNLLVVLIVGGAILVLPFLYWAYDLRVARANLNIEQEKVKTADADARARQMGASSLISSMLSDAAMRWPEGLRERAALQALNMAFESGGAIPDLANLRELTLAKWYSAVRGMLGERYRVTRARQSMLRDGAPACITTDEILAGVDIPGPAKARVRILPPIPQKQSAGLRFVTTENGQDWIEAVTNPADGPIGENLSPTTRVCLGESGFIMTVSSNLPSSSTPASLPRIYEMYWRKCKGDNDCSSGAWQVRWSEILSGTVTREFNRPNSFACVRSVRLQRSADNGTIPNVEIDFTAEEGSKCDPVSPQVGDPTADARFFRATYVAGTRAPVTKRLDPKQKLNFKACEPSKGVIGEGQEKWECDLELPLHRTGIKPLLNWGGPKDRPEARTMWFFPVTDDYALDKVRLFTPAIKAAAIDEDKNIWLKDGDGHIWQLINSRTILKHALWDRAAVLTAENSKWYEQFGEVSMTMTEDEKKSSPPKKP